jgi:hypothetical protein
MNIPTDAGISPQVIQFVKKIPCLIGISIPWTNLRLIFPMMPGINFTPAPPKAPAQPLGADKPRLTVGADSKLSHRAD